MSQKHVSKYDPSRFTVGKIYRDLQMQPNPDRVEIGDMVHEQLKGYVEDINDACKADPFEGRAYYIMIHQKKDLQMKSALLRRVIFTKYRPWPEDDTDVYWYDPKTQDMRFCWALPHHTEMDNILANPGLYDNAYVWMVRCWKAFDLRIFGFCKHDEERWFPHPNWKDKPLKPNSSNKSCAVSAYLV